MFLHVFVVFHMVPSTKLWARCVVDLTKGLNSCPVSQRVAGVASLDPKLSWGL